MHMLAINGVNISGMSMKDVRRLSTGPVDSQVKVIVRRSSVSPPEEGTLTRCATHHHLATYDDRTIVTPRGPLQSDRSDRSTGSSWLRRMFRADGGNLKKSAIAYPASRNIEPSKQYSASQEREMQLQKPGQTHKRVVPDDVQKLASNKRTSDGRLIEYDKNGQVSFCDSCASMELELCTMRWQWCDTTTSIQVLTDVHRLMCMTATTHIHGSRGPLILRPWLGRKCPRSCQDDVKRPLASHTILRLSALT